MIKNFIFIIFVIFILTTDVFPTDYYLTVYNKNVAMVKEVRKGLFKKGENEIDFHDYSDAIIENSFNIKFPTRNISLIEQSLSERILTGTNLLKDNFGQWIELEMSTGEKIKGKLIRYEGKEFILKDSEGKVSIVNDKNILKISMDNVDIRYPVHPVLKWRIMSMVDGQYPYEIDYLLKNINWNAKYIMVISNVDNQAVILSTYFVIRNGNDLAFPGSKVKLVAGDINLRVSKRDENVFTNRASLLTTAKSEPYKIGEREIEENYVFEIDKPVNLGPYETKEVPYFESKKVKAIKLLRSSNRINWQGRKRLDVYYKIPNVRESGLGMTLPAGELSILKVDVDGMLEFLGRDYLGNKSIKDTLVANAGKSFDVSLDRRIIERIRQDPRSENVTVQLKIINRGKKEQKVEIVEFLPSKNYIKSSTHKYSKLQEDRIIFHLVISGESESIIKYTYTYSY